jgi:hypothetical protein
MTVNPEILKDLYRRGLQPEEAYDTFRVEGGKRRKQFFLNEYRQITQNPRAAYNVGGAKRADVKKPNVEKYEKKKQKIKEKVKNGKPRGASTKTGRKRTESHGKKHKRKEELGEGEAPPKPDSAKRSGLDVSAHFMAGSPDLKALKKELQHHGIKFFGGKDKREIVLATDKESGNVHLYGTAIYEASRDKGGKAVGIARELIMKTMKKLGRQTTL